MLLKIIMSGSGLGSMLSGLLEGMGVPWPGAVVLTASGAKFTGIEHAMLLGTLFSVAYTAGSAIQYTFGRFCRSLLERFLSEALRTKLDKAIRKYGQAAVLWTRPLAVGNYISIPAGIMRMNPTRFIIYTFLGIWPWAFGMALAGGVIGDYLAYASDILPIVAAVTVVLAVAAVIRKVWKYCRQPRTETTVE